MQGYGPAAAAPPAAPCPAQSLGAVTLGASRGHRNRAWQALGTGWIAGSSPALPAAHSPARPPPPPPTKHFSFPSGALCNWNGTSETVVLFKSRSLNSPIYSELHPANLNLLGTAEMPTRAVPNPRLPFHFSFHLTASSQALYAGLPPVQAPRWESTSTPMHRGAPLQQEHEDSQP